MKTATFALTNENIARQVSIVKETGNRFHSENQMLTKSCLALEEILLNFQDKFGPERQATIRMKKRAGNYVCTVSLAGECYNPIDPKDGNNNIILDMLGLAPHYTYALGINQITINCKINQGRKELRTILISFLLGILIGIAGTYLPVAVMEPALKLVNAVSDAIFGLMKMIALPVVFLCLICGILGSGTVHSFRQNGVRILRKYLHTMLYMLFIVTVASILGFGIRIETAKSNFAAVDTLIDAIFSMFPSNLLSPFVEGNNIQVILLGVLFGCALLVLGDRTGNVSMNCFQLKDLCSTVMSWVGKLVPVLIVVVIVSNIWSGNIGNEMLSAWKIIAVYFSSVAAIFLYTLIRTANACKIKVSELFGAVSIPGMKGLISASTMFCYEDMVDGLKNKLKITGAAVDFGVPLGYSFYQPATLLYAIFVLYFSKISGVSINITWLLAFMLICFVTGIAVPPVTGGILSLLAVMFANFGIPDSCTAIAFPLMMLLDYPNTAFRVMMLMMEIASEQARQANEAAN